MFLKFSLTKIWAIIFLSLPLFTWGQSSVYRVDFETGAFKGNPKLPFNEAFTIQGEIADDIEMVEINMFYSEGARSINRHAWLRSSNNESKFFEIQILEQLKSKTKYDFEISAYRAMSNTEKDLLRENLIKRVVFYLKNNIYFDGKNVSFNNPRRVFKGLNELLLDATAYQRSKNGIFFTGLSDLVLQELEKQSKFKFSRFINKKQDNKNTAFDKEVNAKITYLADLILSELRPFLNSELVQQKLFTSIRGVQSEGDIVTLPVNAGLYTWNTVTDINNVALNNTSITPGVGFTIPFKRGLQIRNRSFDSFGISAGVLTAPISDASGTKFSTPTVNLPVYAGLGVRVFNVVRINVASLIVAEQGVNNVNNLRFLPSIGIALELDMWLGMRR